MHNQNFQVTECNTISLSLLKALSYKHEPKLSKIKFRFSRQKHDKGVSDSKRNICLSENSILEKEEQKWHASYISWNYF